jgi:hypothetical protein
MCLVFYEVVAGADVAVDDEEEEAVEVEGVSTF